MKLEKYYKAFIEGFDISPDTNVNGLKFNEIEEWDSIGHMSLMSALEDAFDISLETDDIVDFSSFNKGIEILKKYKVQV